MRSVRAGIATIRINLPFLGEIAGFFTIQLGLQGGAEMPARAFAAGRCGTLDGCPLHAEDHFFDFVLAKSVGFLIGSIHVWGGNQFLHVAGAGEQPTRFGSLWTGSLEI